MTSTDTAMHERVAAALKTGESVFSLLIVRLDTDDELAVHAIGYDDSEAEHVVSILREVANEIESVIQGIPNGPAK
jgi:hypothetical protein